MARRLTAKEPEHLTYLQSHLAALKVEDPNAYETFSKHYGVYVDVAVKEPKEAPKEEPKVEAPVEAPAAPVLPKPKRKYTRKATI